MRAWFRRASFYLIADLASRILPFFALPVLAKKMGPDQFGHYALLLTVVNTLAILVGFSTQNSVNISFFKKDAEWRKLAGDLLGAWTLIAISLLLPGMIFAGYFSRWDWVFCLVAAYCTWVFQLTIVVVHVQEKIYQYAALQFLRAALITTLPLLVLFSGAEAASLIFDAYVVAHLILFFCTLVFLARAKIRAGFASIDLKQTWQAHVFALPMVLNAGSGWARASYDRYILALFGSASAVGVYALGFQLGSVLGIAGLSLSKVSSNYVLKYLKSNDPKDGEGVRQAFWVVKIFFLINFSFFLSFLLAMYFFFHKFFGGEYSGAYWTAMVIAAAFSLQSCASLLTPFFQFAHRHSVISKLAAYLSIFSFAVVYFAVKEWSVYGAAISFLFVWILHFGAMMLVLKKSSHSWFLI